MDVLRLVRELVAIDPATADRHQLSRAMGMSAQVRACLDGIDVELGRAMSTKSSFPEKDIADATGGSMRAAATVLERCQTIEAVPAFAAAMAEGGVSGVRVDAVGSALRQVEPAQRRALARLAEQLVDVASEDEFRQRLKLAVRRVQTDGGMERLERQRRAIGLRRWTDRDGMHNFHLRCDPLNAIKVERRVEDAVAELFAEKAPESCPSDPIEKQSHLAGLAMLSLLEGGGAKSGRPEVIVVVDATAVDEDGRPAVDWGLPVEIPDAVLRDVVARAKTHVVAVGPPAELDLGRRHRLASAVQRRVLRGLYPTCAIPGCSVRFDRTKIHHVWWWEQGGPTDLDNLLPICSRHHTAVHDRGWKLKLLPDRTLEITLPDGTTMTTGPPSRVPESRPRAP